MEALSKRDSISIIQENQEIMREMQYQFDADYPLLDTIFSKVESIQDSEKRTRIIKKATVLFCEIAHCQPFLEGNRTTAFYAGRAFLIRNGFRLPLEIASDEDNFKDLLTRTKQNRTEGVTEDVLCREIERWLTEKVLEI